MYVRTPFFSPLSHTQIREKSYERWGGPEGLEEEQDKRKKRKYEAALKQASTIFSKKSK